MKAGRSVCFASLADIISALAKAEREGQLRERIRFLCRTSLLIVDEIGYLPVIPGGGHILSQLVNARYERGAMILTSNLQPRLCRMGRGLRQLIVAQRRCSIGCFTMPSSSRSRDRATVCASTRISCRSTFDPKPPSTRQSRHIRHAAADGRQKMEPLITTRPADRRNPPAREFYFGTFAEI